jgi:EH_Signature domain
MLQLRPIRSPKLNNVLLHKAIVRISKLAGGWESGGNLSPIGLLDEFRKRLKDGLLKGLPFEQCTNVKRREWLLLSLYLNDLGAEESRVCLPPVDKTIIASMLGENPRELKKHLRRLATQLYFTHYGAERLPGLESLCRILELAWRNASRENIDPISKVWSEHADILFSLDAPDKVAERWKPGMSVQELADTFSIHQGGLFRERLMEALILSRLRKIPLAENDLELDDLVVKEKERRLHSALPLGAAAVQILISRCQNENSSTVPENWSEQIVTFACDPRIPNAEMQQRWWRWATSTEKDVAIRALTKISLEEFIRLLEKSLIGKPQGHQFPARRDLLQRLFNRGLVIDARLVVSSGIYQGLNAKMKEILNPSWLRGNQDTSFVCLRCKNDVYLIEGTHSFSLRGFIGEDMFPIKSYWNVPSCEYLTSQFRVDESKCQIYQEHRGRYWSWEFIQQLRQRHIEWEIFR